MSDEIDRSRAEEVADELAIGKEERTMAREERELKRKGRELWEAERRAEKEIEEEWRREHWGHDPQPPPSWPKPQK